MKLSPKCKENAAKMGRQTLEFTVRRPDGTKMISAAIVFPDEKIEKAFHRWFLSYCKHPKK